MRKIKIPDSLIPQLENIKGYGFEYATDEVIQILDTIPDAYTSGYLKAHAEKFSDSLTGDELIEEVIHFAKRLAHIHREEAYKC